MSLVEPGFVQLVAEGLGIKPSDDALKTLAPDVEYRVREIVQEAAKFARHAKRTHIIPEDVNNAFRLRNVEPIYGMSNISDPTRFTRAAGHLDVIYADDPVVPLGLVLDAPLPPVPWEAGIALHWLAVNGKQPAIPENMPLLPPNHSAKRRRTDGAAVEPAAPATAPAAATTPAPAAGPTPAPAAPAVPEDEVLVRAPLKHIVSKELHLYFDKVVKSVQNAPPPPAPPSAALSAALSSLRTDPGLQPLAPYLCQFLAKATGTEAASAPRLTLLMRFAAALTANFDLNLEPWLHELGPPLLACLLAPDLPVGGGDTAVLDTNALHWEAREEAARALASLCAAYPTVAPRMQRHVLAALSAPGASLTTMYGAILGIEAQGPRAVRALLLPNLIPTLAALREDLSGKKGPSRLAAALKVRGALLAAAGHCVYLSGVCAVWKGAAANAPREQQQQPEKGGERKKHGAPRLARMSLQQAVEIAAKAKARRPPGSATKGQRGSGGKPGQAGARKAHAMSLKDVFGEEEAAENAVAEPVPTVVRVGGGGDRDYVVQSVVVPGSLPADNYIAEAWREDFPVEQLRRAMAEVFGSDVEPYERSSGSSSDMGEGVAQKRGLEDDGALFL